MVLWLAFFHFVFLSQSSLSSKLNIVRCCKTSLHNCNFSRDKVLVQLSCKNHPIIFPFTLGAYSILWRASAQPISLIQSAPYSQTPKVVKYSMPSRYSHTNITICWYCVDLWHSKWTTTFKCHKSILYGQGLSINLDKTKVMVFKPTQLCITRSQLECFLGEENVAYRRSYTYPWIKFTRQQFSSQGDSGAWLSHGYVTLVTSHELNRGYLIHLSHPTHLYGVETRGFSLTRQITRKI